MKTTILGGILFLAPLGVLAIILGKVFEISMAMVQPLDRIFGVGTVTGVLLLNVLAVVLIVVVCYLAGLLAERAFMSGRMQKLDGFLADIIPGYAVFKGLVGSASSDTKLSEMMKPVLVRFDDYEQIAFSTEEGATQSVVFLPGAPSAWSGAAVVVDNTRITALNIPTHQATRLLRSFGRGTLGVTPAGAAPPEPASTRVNP